MAHYPISSLTVVLPDDDADISHRLPHCTAPEVSLGFSLMPLLQQSVSFSLHLT